MLAASPAVLKVLYLIFNEGYTASGGDQLYRVDLSIEAIRVAACSLSCCPTNPKSAGLLALMLLTDARRAARTGPNGELIPLDEQVRSLWDQRRIAEGRQVLQRALARGATGPYQIQAAIAALHDEARAPTKPTGDRFWRCTSCCFAFEDSPMARLSHAIALAMVDGPAAGLQALDGLAGDPHFATYHRLDAVRAHLLERAGNLDEAIRHYRRAAAAHREHARTQLSAAARRATQRVRIVGRGALSRCRSVIATPRGRANPDYS